MTNWASNWRQNGWRKQNGAPVLNKELIDYILTILEARHRSGQLVKIQYVKGHSGDRGNNGADALAVAGRGRPALPERYWAGLKRPYQQELDMIPDLIGIDPDVSPSSRPDRTTGYLTDKT